MKILAAVTRAPHAAMTLETLEIDAPRDTEILVRVVATGVCHTDIVVRDGMLPTPLPAVLGHEGAGIVEAVGRKVTKVVPGDHVVMSYNSCGHCPSCDAHAPSYCHEFFPRNFLADRPDGTSALRGGDGMVHSNFFGQSSFATHAICHERNIVKVPREARLELLGPLACGIQTGAGAVFETHKVAEGQTVAVFGCGSVGLAALMAAKVAGAREIIAVDTNEARLDFARSIGATLTINPATTPATEAILKHTRYGVDHAIDTTGIAAVIRHAVDSLAPRGTCGMIGASAPGSEVTLDEVHFLSGGRRLVGIVEGGAIPDQLIPKLIALHAEGRFPFDRMVKFYPFAEINTAIADSENGHCIKPIVLMPEV
ncbi:NAD(P)-dependent alcohol dehydrogenase [Denitromonas iodatirespirans]|uniref:NAD(P)-dependent alcohol dehydrogenase n=1 Tax=Denitromonas iodatirespirans TaxID=2795389 RepID=A0A944DQV8_DENI1|nr:NAD(P)-dependent alcohol dehydrogenase [Denitromonas iodatirespirans]MBT0962944.1 NAD(P)-dependent alcohol dehydrogenase [Denitromonas iodatirespirans]